jgi:signal transduction histidine kinase
VSSEDHTARLFGVGQRLRQWDTRHRWVFDVAVVAAVFLVFALPDLGHDRDNSDGPVAFTQRAPVEMLLLQLAMILPLGWRRRAPLATLYVSSGVFIAEWSFGIMIRAHIALLVAVYSLVLHGRLSRLPWAAPPLIAAYVLVVVRLFDTVGLWDLMFFLAVVGSAAVALGFAIRIRRAQVASLRDRAVQLEIERDQRSKLAAAEERTRVAREMHDIVGHSLAVIVTLADAGEFAAEVAPERSKEALRLIADNGRRSLAELRRMLGVMREPSEGGPSLRPQPGIADLEPLSRQIRAAGPQVRYSTSGELSELDPGVQLTAYRIVQEALTNALKHAGPRTSLDLALRLDDDRLRISVRDTGPPDGARPANPPQQGHGLVGMSERAGMYGGKVTAGPAPGGGWCVEAYLDLTPEGDPM